MQRPSALALLAAAMLVAALCADTAAAATRSLKAAPKPENADVVVIGAGYAGLSAAKDLTKAGYSVVVVEANTVIGGRGKRVLLKPPAVKADLWVDLGGQWVGETHTQLLAMLKEYKVPIYTSPHDEGEVAIVWDNATLGSQGACWDCITLPNNGTIERPEPLVEVYDAAVRAKDPRAAGVKAIIDAYTVFGDISQNITASPDSQLAVDLDDMTYKDWLYAQTSNELARQVILLGASIGDTEPWWSSALSYAQAAATGPATEAPEKFLIKGGAGQIPQRLAKDIEAKSGRILVKEPVVRIQQDVGGVTVHTEQRAFRASAVLVAMPPHLAGRIEYDPPLPAVRDQMTQRVFMGSVTKCVATFERPFWRDDPKSNLSFVMYPQGKGPVRNMYDISPPIAMGGGGSGVLAGFIDAGATRWFNASGEQLKAAVLASFAEIVGPGALNATGFVAKVWAAEPFTGGAYNSVFPPGVITQYAKAFDSPTGLGGRIFWAGTDTAPVWAGFFEGAILSGRQAAKDIMADRAKVPKTGTFSGKLTRKTSVGKTSPYYLGPGGYIL